MDEPPYDNHFFGTRVCRTKPQKLFDCWIFSDDRVPFPTATLGATALPEFRRWPREYERSHCKQQPLSPLAASKTQIGS
jgi:hypothetical protein